MAFSIWINFAKKFFIRDHCNLSEFFSLNNRNVMFIKNKQKTMHIINFFRRRTPMNILDQTKLKQVPKFIYVKLVYSLLNLESLPVREKQFSKKVFNLSPNYFQWLKLPKRVNKIWKLPKDWNKTVLFYPRSLSQLLYFRLYLLLKVSSRLSDKVWIKKRQRQ